MHLIGLESHGPRMSQQEPLSPAATGVLYAFLAMVGTAVVIAVGLAIGLHGARGLDGLGPIFWSMGAALVGLPTAAIAGFLYGRQRGQLAQMEHMMADIEEPPEPPTP